MSGILPEPVSYQCTGAKPTLAVHAPYRRLNMLSLRRYSDVNHLLCTSYFTMIYIKFILSLSPGSLSELRVRRIKN